jgi:hypothetical protein
MNNIPGYLINAECDLLVTLVSSVNKTDAIAVEIGSLHGKSSSIIAKALSQGTLHCIDPWWGNDSSVKNITEEDARRKSWPVPGTKNTLEFFLENTADCKNIVAHKKLSPSGIAYLNIKCDFLFLDGAHTNPNDRENIDYWLPRMNSGGIFAGHDYNKYGNWPDIIDNVRYLEQKLGKPVTNPPGTTIWYFICD